MAGTAVSDFGNFLDGIAPNVALNLEKLMAPLERIHNVVRLAPGQDAAMFPVLNSGLSMAQVTDGTAYNTQTALPIGSVTVTPIPYEAQVLVSEFAVMNNPSNYMQIVSEEIARAAHAQLQTLLIAVYDDFTPTVSGTTLSVSGLNTALTALRTNGVNGQIYANVAPKCYGDLVADVTANYGLSSLAQSALGEGRMAPVLGVEVWEDSSITASTWYKNFIGAKDAIGICWGVEPKISVIPVDGTHVKICGSMWVGVGAVATNRALWLMNT